MQVGKARKTEKKLKKVETVKKFGLSATNTGSTETQIALITDRISELTPHFQKHVKDFHSRRGLLKLVGQRRRLLTYLKSKDMARYTDILSKLELRK
jgi:small subunit ribosomal protein S15